jgi:hypothetical protein
MKPYLYIGQLFQYAKISFIFTTFSESCSVKILAACIYILNDGVSLSP